MYGGQSIEQQIKNIKRGADIIVGTPGRIIDLLERKVLNLSELDYFVLDEADEMLNMGFIDAIEEILKQTNKKQKMLFFSATMPSEILAIAKRYMHDFKILKIENKEITQNLTEQIYYALRENEKFDTLCRILDFTSDFYGIIFARTKFETDDITLRLKSRGFNVEALHGDISQALRNKTLASFKSKTINILIATDVAARGIDVNNLTHVINYSLPQDAESYVHRIGRTGRAGNKGTAISFVARKDSFLLNRIQKMTKAVIRHEAAPTSNQVIEAKKINLDTKVKNIINDKEYHDYLDLAKNLINKNNDPIVVTAALLRHVYGDEFLPQYYKAMNDYKTAEISSNYNNDQSRLFVALGKRDGYNPKKLLDLLHTECKTPSRKVQNIKILDNFSFISVPEDEAEIILRTINKNDRRSKPLVTRAKN